MGLLLKAPMAFSTTEADALKLFAWIESTYSNVLGAPRSAGSVSRAQGYTYRYYPDSGIYLALYGDTLYGTGGALGAEIITVGTTSQFISKTVTDITDKNLTLRDGICSYYASKSIASAKDLSNNWTQPASVNISMDGKTCMISSNSIPNHSFADATNSFTNTVKQINAEYRITSEPAHAAQTTPLSLTLDNGVFLNGVKLDLIAAGCFGVNDGNKGCSDMSQEWRYDPMSSNAKHRTDSHNAHAQADGTYHYHGDPNALFTQYPLSESPVIGFAADGYPIFGSYIKDSNGAIRKASSSYELRAGARPTSQGSPEGSYDGTYRDDYQFSDGAGDLDECNGMTHSGVYGYYVTDAFPWVLNCFKGTPNPSFQKAAPPNNPEAQNGVLLEVINYSNTQDSDIAKYVATAAAKMANQVANVFVAVWPIGPLESKGGFDSCCARPGLSTHKVILNADQIDTIVSRATDWQSIVCKNKRDDAGQRSEILRLRKFLEYGADVDGHFEFCSGSRALFVSVREYKEDYWNEYEVASVVIHETYHALQHDIGGDSSCRYDSGVNSQWIKEAGAIYFADVVTHGLGIKDSKKNSKNAKSLMLEKALNAYQYEGVLDLYAGNKEPGAAALALMVERGELDEKTILDGSLFWSCARAKIYTNSHPSIIKAKNLWFLIERNSAGEYVFRPEALQ